MIISLKHYSILKLCLLDDGRDKGLTYSCYVHVLNLLIAETTKFLCNFSFFFQFVLEFSTLESIQKNGCVDRSWITTRIKKIKLLKLIVKTRRLGKSSVATTILSSFDDFTFSISINLLTCLSIIHDSKMFDRKTNYIANALFQSLLKIKKYIKKITQLYRF